MGREHGKLSWSGDRSVGEEGVLALRPIAVVSLRLGVYRCFASPVGPLTAGWSVRLGLGPLAFQRVAAPRAESRYGFVRWLGVVQECAKGRRLRDVLGLWGYGLDAEAA